MASSGVGGGADPGDVAGGDLLAAVVDVADVDRSMINALRAQLAPDGIRVTGLQVTAPKSDPVEIARIAVDGLDNDLAEILADETSRQVQAGLAGGVAALYPALA